jgi:hypothetical protein
VYAPAMRTTLTIMILVAACKSGDSHKPHDPVSGPAMWRVHLDELTIQAIDGNDKPTGAVTTVTEREANTQIGCRLAADPGNAPITTWNTVSIDETGHVRFTHGSDTSVPKDVNNCAGQATANIKLTTTPGDYKVTAKVWFSDPQPQ